MSSLNPTRLLAILVALLLPITACGSSDEAGDDVGAPADSQGATSETTDGDSSTAEEPTDESAADAAEPVADEGDEPAEDSTAADDGTEPADEADSDQPTEAPEPEPEERILPLLDAEADGDGPRPTLSWTPVDGADSYQLVVLGADGGPYWAWSGTEVSVPFGGIEDPDVVGPWVHEPMTWTVVALDTEGTPLALSDPVPLMP